MRDPRILMIGRSAAGLPQPRRQPCATKTKTSPFLPEVFSPASQTRGSEAGPCFWAV